MPDKPPISSNNSVVATAIPSTAGTRLGHAPGKYRRPAGQPVEVGGPRGPEPTRYGDWERKGRCIDF